MKKTLVMLIVSALAGTIFLFACKKHHHSTPTTPIDPWDETVFWNSVTGHYKVYDTTGDFIYEMNISRITVDGNENIAKFENFDGEFTFTAPRSYYYPKYVNFGAYDTLYDLNNKRWKLGEVANTYYNNMHGDTLPLYFHITNINYWIYDAVPYYSAFIKQVAIKQH